MRISRFRVVDNDQILNISLENCIFHQLPSNNYDTSKINVGWIAPLQRKRLIFLAVKQHSHGITFHRKCHSVPLAIRQIDIVESWRILTARSSIHIFIPKQRPGTNLNCQFFVAILPIVDGEQEGGILIVWSNGGQDGKILRESIRENRIRRHAELSIFI